MRIALVACFVAALALAAPEAGGDFAALAEAVAAAHDLADRLSMSDPAAGARELEAVLEAPFPKGEPSRALRLDLFAHASELHLVAKAPALALASARRGLAEDQGHAADRWTAQLVLKEAEALEASGDEPGAVQAYSKAIAIAKRLLAERGSKEAAP